MTPFSLEEKRFSCQRSGHCCCDRKIVVTLTYRDIFRLYIALDSNFQRLLQKITFYKIDKKNQSFEMKQMVLAFIKTSQGKIVPGLRKRNDNSCVFYFSPNCAIYDSRPLACKNYPIAFIEENNKISCVWAKDSVISCPGIGKGPTLDPLIVKKQGINYFKEISTHNYVVGELNDEAEKGKPLTAREALWILLVYGEKENFNYPKT